MACSRLYRLLAWYCRLSVCLSDEVWRLFWINDTSYSKRVWTSEQEVPSKEHDFITSSHLHQRHPLKPPPHLLNRRGWCHLVNTFKTILWTSAAPKFTRPEYHRRHATRLLQTTPYARLLLSNSWASCSPDLNNVGLNKINCVSRNLTEKKYKKYKQKQEFKQKAANFVKKVGDGKH